MPNRLFSSENPADAAGEAMKFYKRLTGADHADEVAVGTGTSFHDHGVKKTISVFETKEGPVTYEVTQGLAQTNITVRYPKALEGKASEQDKTPI